MSNVIAELTVPVGADLSALEAGLSRIAPLLNAAAQQAANATASLATAGDAGAAAFSRFAAQMQTAQAKLAQMQGDNLAVLRNTFKDLVPDSELAKLQQVQEQIRQVTDAQQAEQQAAKAAQASMAAADTARARAAQEAARAEQSAIRAAEQAQSRANTLRNQAITHVGNVASQVASAMARAGDAGLSVVGKMVKAAGEFESNLNVFQATSHATGAEMEQVSKKAIALGNDISLPATSAKTAIDAMTALNRTGLSLNDTLAASRASLMLAAAGHLEAGKAAQFVGQALNQFKLSGDQANRTVDIMAALLPAAGSKIEATAGAFRMGGTAAAQAKIPMADFATEVGMMSRAGLQGTRAGTALATMFANLQAPSAGAQKVLSALNVSIFDGEGHMKSQREIIQQLGGALSSLSDKDRDYAEKTLFSANARRAANVVLLQSVDAFDAMQKKVTASGEAQRQSEAAMKGYRGAMEALNNQFETLQITLGQKLIPQVTEFTKNVSGLVERFNALSDGQQGAIIKGTVAALAFGSAIGRLAGFTNTLLQIRSSWIAIAAAADAAKVSQMAAAAAGTGGGAAAAGGSAVAEGAGGVAAGAGGVAAGLAAIPLAMAAVTGGALYMSAKEDEKGSDAEQRTIEDQSRIDATTRQLAQLAKLRAELKQDPGEPALVKRLRQLEMQIRTAHNMVGEVVPKGTPLFETNPAPKGTGAGRSTGDPGAAAPSSDLSGRIAALAAAQKQQAAAHKAALVEQARYTKELTQEQQRLSEAMTGGDKSAQAFAARLVGLTAAHRAQITAVHEQVRAANEAAKSRAEQDQQERKYLVALSETENRIRAANGTEISGLEKLRATYPKVAESKLQFLLARQQAAKSAEEEQSTLQKLTTTLANLKSEIGDGTAKDTIHKVAVELTGRAYETLSKAAQSAVGQITALKQQIAETSAHDAIVNKAQAAARRIQEMGFAAISARKEIAQLNATMAEGKQQQAELERSIQQGKDSGRYGQQDIDAIESLKKRIGTASSASERISLLNDIDQYSPEARQAAAQQEQLAKLQQQQQSNAERLKEQQVKLTQDLAGSAQSAVRNAAAQIAAQIDGTGGLLSVGKNMMDGLADGIRDGTSSVVNAIVDAAQQGVAAARNTLGIQSPSRVFATIGQYTVDGLAVGIRNGTSTVAQAVAGMAQMTVTQAIGALQASLAAAQQASVNNTFADMVVRAQRQHDLLLAQEMGATNPFQSGDMMAAGYYQQARVMVAQSGSDTASGGGQTFTKQDIAQQQRQPASVNIAAIHIHVNGVTDAGSFNYSRQQIMQSMYEEAQKSSIRNG